MTLKGKIVSFKDRTSKRKKKALENPKLIDLFQKAVKKIARESRHSS